MRTVNICQGKYVLTAKWEKHQNLVRETFLYIQDVKGVNCIHLNQNRMQWQACIEKVITNPLAPMLHT